jgi:hypothetical protein
MVYGNTETPFMAAPAPSGRAGCRTAWGCWWGRRRNPSFVARVRPDTAPVLQMLQAG